MLSKQANRSRVYRTCVLGACLLLFSTSTWAAFSPCDLNDDGVVNVLDVQLAVDMYLGSIPCTATIDDGACNQYVVTQVVSGALGGACVVANTTHSVSLSWTASASTVTGYNVYRGTTSGGPYTQLNSSLVTATSYTDSSVLPGMTYFYVATAVGTSNEDSAYSNQASATVPSP